MYSSNLFLMLDCQTATSRGFLLIKRKRMCLFLYKIQSKSVTGYWKIYAYIIEIYIFYNNIVTLISFRKKNLIRTFTFWIGIYLIYFSIAEPGILLIILYCAKWKRSQNVTFLTDVEFETSHFYFVSPVTTSNFFSIIIFLFIHLFR